MYRIGLLALALLVTPAKADMLDYGFAFTNQAQAIAAAEMLAGHYQLGVGWMQDHVIPGMQCWRPSQDTTSGSPPVTTHNFLAGYYVLVSVDNGTATPIPILANAASLKFILNRTARETIDAGHPNGYPFVVSNKIGAVLADLGCQPMYQSPNPYPVGGFN